MNINFVSNDYITIWNLLFGASISKESQEFKKKLYMNYKDEYMALEKDQSKIIKNYKNFIPDNDTVYNLVLDSDMYKSIKKDSEHHRMFLMSSWDKNKKKILEHIFEIIRMDIEDDYNIMVVPPRMNVVYYNYANKEKNIVWGRESDMKSGLGAILSIMYSLLRYEIGLLDNKYEEIINAVLELAINNELYTRVTGKSNYYKIVGDKGLSYLKKMIYPYWLMYLGYTKDEFPRYMMRDKVPFNIEDYEVEEELASLDLVEFIKFCIKNQKQILRIENIEIM